ncbi:hypothetical protein [Methanotorris formicicus]|uniref:Uncharacterized protein n=1 Tax=Methanotorris formicicus Mc-S-70 TaxID=647171 RepID=H1KXT9_9EURY|nr:hypothetical protein [Methanotorris formicicus]EHP87931.1 hypothetical protein MetfoDRAFT_0612 [Methanotorris formicicus Mc-S-70]
MKKIVLMLIIFLIMGNVFGYYFGYIKVSGSNPLYEKEFDIEKVGNYTYYLNFVHYGNINESMEINIYLNGDLVYKIDDSNDAFPANKKNTSVDVTSYLKDGKNVLKVEGINLTGRYYVLDDTQIIEPIKTPITPKSILTILLILTYILYVRK